jgi:hypothetical protein
MFQHICKHAKPVGETQNGISKILVPSIPGEQINSQSNLQHILETHTDDDIFWETVIDRKEMEEYLLRYNQRLFQAGASISPCGHRPIYEAMKFTGVSLPADQLLSGTIPPEWDTDHTRLLMISYCCSPDRIKVKRPQTTHPPRTHSSNKKFRRTTYSMASNRGKKRHPLHPPDAIWDTIDR